ncbi:DNA mismatch repair protein [Methylococcaceae bacterium WWC4]|nr:DNA mismatch repair protein [Methylococcaceae bacterium WWC4]
MSGNKSIKVQVKKDHISKQTKSQPIQALAEIIWNALDADATKVEVLFKENPTEGLGIEQIILRDNGHGMPYQDADQLFSSLGGSWKAHRRVSQQQQRFLHGQEGKGRFKAFALGRVVEWHVNYKENDHFYAFNIQGRADDIDQFLLSEITQPDVKKTGVEVIISELHKQFKLLDADYAIEKLAPVFALYLSNYPGIILSVVGQKLQIESLISRRDSYQLQPIQFEGKEYAYEMEIIEWNQLNEKEIHFCNAQGLPLYRHEKLINGVSAYSFTAYIKSEHISELHNAGNLEMFEWDPSLQSVLKNAESVIKQHFLQRRIDDSCHILQKWKEEKVYPYENEPGTTVEDAERKVFDIVALNINESLPAFDKTDNKTKTFQFRMLRQSIEKSPEDLQTIIKEVLNLPSEKQQELVELLQETSLSSIITASRLVADRLKFLAGLEEIIFSPDTRHTFKERSQLHRILAKNTWIFGDAFSLAVDDKSLTQVLKKHADAHGIEAIIDEPVKRIDGSVGIVDLMLTRSIPRNHSDEREHLVVELKQPKIAIGSKEISQIKSYAFAVAEDERFRTLKSKWNFWVISNDYDSYAKRERSQKGYSDGVIYQSDHTDETNITIWIKTWSEVISECKHRMEFLKSHLDYNIDANDGLKYLKDKYAEYTKGVLDHIV